MKHILVVSQYFYPEQFRINDICAEWVKRGYKVTVLTGIPNYPIGKYFDNYGLLKNRRETFQGIDIIRIPLIPRGNNPLMLVLNYISFVVSGFIWQFFTSVKADLVFIFEVSPMTQALPGVWYANKREIPCHIYVQDLWPENVEIITGIKNERFLNSIGKMVDYIYKNSDYIFTTSKSFVNSIHKRGIDYDKIVYWPQYAEDFYVPKAFKEIDGISNKDTFNIIFAGNIGTAQGLEVLLKTAILLKRKSIDGLKFNLVGDGRYREELIKLIRLNECDELFNFIPKQMAQRIPEFLAASDLAFLSLTNHPLFSMTIPAKLQTYMACGIPILASATGETENIINESKSGICCKPGNAEELADSIMKLKRMSKVELNQLGKNARSYYEENFDKKTLLDEMDRYFEMK